MGSWLLAAAERKRKKQKKSREILNFKEAEEKVQ